MIRNLTLCALQLIYTYFFKENQNSLDFYKTPWEEKQKHLLLQLYLHHTAT